MGSWGMRRRSFAPDAFYGMLLILSTNRNCWPVAGTLCCSLMLQNNFPDIIVLELNDIQIAIFWIIGNAIWIIKLC